MPRPPYHSAHTCPPLITRGRHTDVHKRKLSPARDTIYQLLVTRPPPPRPRAPLLRSCARPAVEGRFSARVCAAPPPYFHIIFVHFCCGWLTCRVTSRNRASEAGRCQASVSPPVFYGPFK